MKTTIAIDGTRFLINGSPTYAGRTYEGRPVEGLLFNSRMVQAIFDDANPATAVQWRYPDTGGWDARRNTSEFCAALPLYRRHGVLAVTVGLQGGGAVFTPDIYNHYLNSAYLPDGTFVPAYFDRLRQVLQAADDAGMAVIVNYFYWKQAARLKGGAVVARITTAVTDWLLRTGFQNILVDVMNEAHVGRPWPGLCEQLSAQRIHDLIEIVQQTTLNGRRLLAGASTGGGDCLPFGRWQEVEDFHMPHGNGCTPERLRAKLRALKDSAPFRARPRPVLINEDSICLDNLDAACDEYASWGYYSQGFGSAYKDRTDWTIKPREAAYPELSGFQTVPVNWQINTGEKRAFFQRVAAITGISPADAA